MNSRQRTLGHAAALMTILIWGTTFVSTKVLLRDFTPVTVLFTRFVIGYAFLWCLKPRLLPLSGWKKELLFAGAGLTGVTLYFLLENIALTYTFASNVGIIVAVVPFFTALLAHFLLKGEGFSRRFFLGFAAAFTGIFLIMANGAFVLELNPAGDVLALGAAFVWAVYSILMKKIGVNTSNMIICTRRIFFYGIVLMIPALFVLPVNMDWHLMVKPVNALNLLYLRPVLPLLEPRGGNPGSRQIQRVHLHGSGRGRSGLRHHPGGTPDLDIPDGDSPDPLRRHDFRVQEKNAEERQRKGRKARSAKRLIPPAFRNHAVFSRKKNGWRIFPDGMPPALQRFPPPEDGC